MVLFVTKGVFGRAPRSSRSTKTAPLHFFHAKHPSSKNSRSTKSMDLAPNSTKSMECLKGYSAKACFALTRGVGWKLPTIATHYTTYRFNSFFPRLPPHAIFASLSRPVAFLLHCSRAAACSFGVGEQMALVGTTSSTRFHIALVRPATRA
jgi:hypothetical protein